MRECRTVGDLMAELSKYDPRANVGLANMSAVAVLDSYGGPTIVPARSLVSHYSETR